ncbi:hypothetical protein N9B82_06775, partial [Saprospiraceae bacterium]|nr:hypothetical protein [Saprospiraceae bacterium]
AQMVEYDNALYFYAFDDDLGDGLWKSDGTEVGTELIYEFNGNTTTVERRVYSVGDRLLITAEQDSYEGFELFQSFGTPQSTELIKDIFPNSSDGKPNNFNVINEQVFMSAQESSSNVELFRMDFSTVIPIEAFFSIKKNNDCFGFTQGELKVVPSGGTEPYSYAWNPSNLEGDNPKNLPAGEYSVTITDAVGETFELTETITQPDDIILTVGKEDATTGNSDGKAYVNAVGGTPTYFYTWIGQTSTTDTLFNVPAGDYTIVVSDTKVCSKEETITVDETVNSENIALSQVLIYPTVTSNSFYIDKGELPQLAVKIIRQDGVQIDQFETSINMNYDVSEMIPSTYFLMISSEGYRSVRSFIVSN